MVILLIVLIVFGAGKLPQIGGALGKSIHEFRKASRGEDEAKPEVKKTEASATPQEKK
jgi:sec-independent protein translocase protein TatA